MKTSGAISAGGSKRLARVLAGAMAVILWAGSAPGQAGPRGNGTASNPYLIKSTTHLKWMELTAATSRGKHYRLTQNIDARTTAGWNGRRGFVPIGTGTKPFNGNFDGNGKYILGLTINRPSQDYVGLFGAIGKYGTVRNLSLRSGRIVGKTDVGALAGINEGKVQGCNASTPVTGDYIVGGLVGNNFRGTVSVCRASGAVRGNDTAGGLLGINNKNGLASRCRATGSVSGSRTIGGLAGINGEGARLVESYATGTVRGSAFGAGGLVGQNAYRGTISRCSATGRVTGNEEVGGLAGESTSRATIAECFASGLVEGETHVGGLVGRSFSSLTDCYARGRVRGRRNVGGLVGYLGGDRGGTAARCYSSGSVTGLTTSLAGTVGGLVGVNPGGDDATRTSYWDMLTSRQEFSAGGTGKTTAQMRRAATFVSWNFRSVWAISQNRTYPTLRRAAKP